MSKSNTAGRGFWKSWTGMCLLTVGGVAAYFLIADHQEHLLGWLPLLLLLACPLMHIFMHGRHGGHAGHGHPHPARPMDKSECESTVTEIPAQEPEREGATGHAGGSALNTTGSSAIGDSRIPEQLIK